MTHWLRKIFVVLVTIVTFGTIAPGHGLQLPVKTNHSSKTNIIDQKAVEEDHSEDFQIMEESYSAIFDEDIGNWRDIAQSIHHVEDLKSHFYDYSMRHATNQAMIKFGSIGNVIGDEFREVVLPGIEKAIETVTGELQSEDLKHLAITESPAGGIGEKIFHIYNEANGKDVIRFHVRRDHPPQEGYWFNFHYHTYTDNFVKHYNLANIYWDKNTPPNWMS